MSKIKWNSEKMLSISAMSMSFFTLLIFIYQTNLMRKQNYLSILPYLTVATTTNSAAPVFELNLQNHGVGPAIIESVNVTYKDTTYNLIDFDNKMYKFLVFLAPKLDSIKSYSHSPMSKGMAIPANSIYNILRVSDSSEEFLLMAQTIKFLLEDGMNYKIIYKSIQDEHWLIHHNSQGPQKLN